MNILPFQNVLALSAHTDDMEYGCGALIHRLIKQGAQVTSAVFSICEDSVPVGFPDDILLSEMYQAAKELGLAKENINVFRYPVRKLPQYRQEILEELVKLAKISQPDLVLTPSSQDIHQDHQVIYQESIRAFRYITLLGYELPWNTIAFTASGIIEVTRPDLQAKARAISCYKSQQFRHYSKFEFFESMARLRGTQQKKEFAEAFEVIRLSL